MRIESILRGLMFCLILPAAANACYLINTDCDAADASCNEGIAAVLAAGFATATVLSPDQVSGLRVWLAADNVTGLIDGQGVSNWPDSSGNNNFAAQNTGSLQPLWKENVLNGRAVLRFDGADDGMNIADNSAYKSVAMNMLVVAKHNGGGGSVQIVFAYSHLLGVHSTPFFRWAFAYSTSGKISIRNGVGTSASFVVNPNWSSYSIYSYQTNPGLVRINGVFFMGSVDGAITYPNAAGLVLGYNAVGAETFMGDIAEVILYDSSLSDLNRNAVECYLSLKYGITVAQSC